MEADSKPMFSSEVSSKRRHDDDNQGNFNNSSFLKLNIIFRYWGWSGGRCEEKTNAGRSWHWTKIGEYDQKIGWGLKRRKRWECIGNSGEHIGREFGPVWGPNNSHFIWMVSNKIPN